LKEGNTYVPWGISILGFRQIIERDGEEEEEKEEEASEETNYRYARWEAGHMRRRLSFKSHSPA
jgi:hypothetical protein